MSQAWDKKMDPQDFVADTVCGSSVVPGLRIFGKTAIFRLILHVDLRLSPTCPRLHLVGFARSRAP